MAARLGLIFRAPLPWAPTHSRKVVAEPAHTPLPILPNLLFSQLPAVPLNPTLPLSTLE